MRGSQTSSVQSMYSTRTRKYSLRGPGARDVREREGHVRCPSGGLVDVDRPDECRRAVIARTDDQLRDPPRLCPTGPLDERRSQPKVVPLRGGLTEWMGHATDVASAPTLIWSEYVPSASAIRSGQ